MSELKPVYEIKTVGDFLKVPFDRREACLAEFASFLDSAEHLAELFTGGVLTLVFEWCDDGIQTTADDGREQVKGELTMIMDRVADAIYGEPK